MSIITYLIIGTAFAFLVDMASNLVGERVFNTLERIIAIISWPLTLPIFIIAFIKELFKKE
tara:strand:- start:3124 stop:3306 length:183 start_codon:yes stop_codon:yes gene_type:complete